MPSVQDVAQLDDAAIKLIARIEAFAPQLCEKIPHFHDRILKPLRRLKEIRFDTISADAAFEWREADSAMIMNAGHVATIMSQIEAAEEAFAATPKVKALDLATMRAMAVNLFTLHELRHLSQGIPHFSGVQQLKQTEGAQLLTKLDIAADVDAAVTLAWLKALEEDGDTRARFSCNLGDALYFLCFVCVPAFGISAEKPTKVTRALSLYLMFLRATLIEFASSSEPSSGIANLPVEAALIPVFSPDYRLVTLSTTYPELTVIGTFDVDPTWGPALATYVAENNFAKALEVAVAFASTLLK